MGAAALAFGALVAVAPAAPVALAQRIGGPEIETTRGNRRVDVDWSAGVEVEDALFGGYQVWRAAVSPDPANFILLRRFERRYPITWTYCGRQVGFPECDPVSADTPRSFVDPDSIVKLIKIEINADGDSAMSREYLGIPPHNGFPYYYAVTWFSECLTARRDTLRIDQPQPRFVVVETDPDTVWGFVDDLDGTRHVVDRVPCRRIDPITNRAVGDTILVFQGTAESDNALRLYAIEATRNESPTFPSTTIQPDVQQARAIPNPYVISAEWDQGSDRKIQFINLTERATVRIFSLAGDLVREIDHPDSGAAPNQGSVDWDLRNAHGRQVVPGIYIFHVVSPDHFVDTTGRLVIVY